MSGINQPSKASLNLWSSNKKPLFDNVFQKLKELRYKGGYYEEIGLPDFELVFRGLLQDIEILKKQNNELSTEIKKLKNENSI